MTPIQKIAEPLKVHILGAGALGSLVAHDLKMFQQQRPVLPALLLRPNKSSIKDRFIRVKSPDHVHRAKDSSVEVPVDKAKDLQGNSIENLIITTKCFQTEAALQPYIENLSSKSNVLILQNGMGMPDFLTKRFWVNSSNCPKFFEAITTHGVYVDEHGVVNHASKGTLQISSNNGLATNELPEMIRAILNTPSLNAEYVEYHDFILLQMQKLVINCCINPLSAIFDVPNGNLLYGEDTIKLWKSIITECLEIFHVEYPILEEIPQSRAFLSESRLLDIVTSVCRSTALNSSSMRQDVRNLRNTEIDNLNGYISFLGKKHNKATFTNSMITSMVKTKLGIDRGVDKAAADAILSL
ncbi:PAN5 [Candida theae]|uniref:2-dehydropantoate 2-reductase n=1 Tax=Candida theae TaxID=1198502 RepID=A0AAD5BJB0_9ASCO|nr:PAN5 [Candida theae]KAI5968182.1 PAN5 [Candida theae]